jgi:hypothetical protein
MESAPFLSLSASEVQSPVAHVTSARESIVSPLSPHVGASVSPGRAVPALDATYGPLLDKLLAKFGVLTNGHERTGNHPIEGTTIYIAECDVEVRGPTHSHATAHLRVLHARDPLLLCRLTMVFFERTSSKT